MKDINFNITLFNFYRCFNMVQFEISVLSITRNDSESSLLSYFKDGNYNGINILFFKVRWTKI